MSEEQSNKTIRKNEKLEKKVTKRLNDERIPTQVKTELLAHMMAAKKSDEVILSQKQLVHEGLGIFDQKFVPTVGYKILLF